MVHFILWNFFKRVDEKLLMNTCRFSEKKRQHFVEHTIPNYVMMKLAMLHFRFAKVNTILFYRK